MGNPRLEVLLESFGRRGIKFIDVKTGEEIEPIAVETVTCSICDNKTPVGNRCMWCQNKLGAK